MDDMNAFDRQLASVVLERVGPSEPVDDLAIFEAVVSRPSRWGFTVFSALKFVAAAAIVALFGGFLLAGVLTAPQDDVMAPAALTASPSPMTTDELLSGMVTEEVKPGVLRVINDGVRELVLGGDTGIVAGYDGGIWLLREGGFLRLGSEVSHEWPDESAAFDGRIFEVAPDGTVWIIAARYPLITGSRGGEALRSVDGEVWAAQPCPGSCSGITVAPDGEVWASSFRTVGRWSADQLDPTGWKPLDGQFPESSSVSGFDRFFRTDNGDLYATACPWGCSLYRYDDGTWSRISDFGFDTSVDVGRDGTVWLSGGTWLEGEPHSQEVPVPEWDTMVSEFSGGLARLAGGEWTGWTPADLPAVDIPVGRVVADEAEADLPVRLGDDEFGVAPDRSLLWVSSSCDGLLRFDGETADRFLPGQCVSMDTAADGSVWVLADHLDGKDLYVITPEALAGTR